MKLSKLVASSEKAAYKYIRKFKKDFVKKVNLKILTVALTIFAVVIFIIGLVWWPVNHPPMAYVAGINYFDFPIQIKINDVFFQVAPFNTYNFTLPEKSTSVSVQALYLNGQIIQSVKHTSNNTWWVGLDVWGKDLNACGVVNNISALEYGASKLSYYNIQPSSSTTKATSFTLTSNESPSFTTILDDFKNLPKNILQTDSVWHVGLTTCTNDYNQDKVKSIWEYWRAYKPQVQEQELNNQIQNLNLLPDYNN